MTGHVRMAIVGAGGIGHAYAEALRQVEEVELVAVADVRQDAGQRLAEAHGVRHVVDPLTFAHQDVLDLVLLCTPPSTHEPLAVAFLEAGVPVMCEKPLAPSRAAGQHIVAVAAATGTPLTMASKFRFATDVIEARAIIQSGMLGELISAEVAFAAPVDMSQRWNSDPAVSGGGVLIDNGTHAVDVLRYLLGPIDSVLATTSSRGSGLGVEDTALVLTRTADDRLGSIALSWSVNRLTDRYLAVFGTEGSLEVGWQSSRSRLRSNSSDVPFGVGYDKFTALGGNVRNVARAIRGLEPLMVTPLDALASVAVVEAAYDSARSGAWTRVSVRTQERLTG
ncbi:MAG TPA: Gfo/Idh/MocA family oxidoreductase [Propionibacteriaceae bacterium]|nr:Gfo/Idh/MocA family oxidoreductase [Propionibacteriaceae bacterium]